MKQSFIQTQLDRITIGQLRNIKRLVDIALAKKELEHE